RRLSSRTEPFRRRSSPSAHSRDWIGWAKGEEAVLCSESSGRPRRSHRRSAQAWKRSRGPRAFSNLGEARTLKGRSDERDGSRGRPAPVDGAGEGGDHHTPRRRADRALGESGGGRGDREGGAPVSTAPNGPGAAVRFGAPRQRRLQPAQGVHGSPRSRIGPPPLPPRVGGGLDDPDPPGSGRPGGGAAHAGG